MGTGLDAISLSNILRYWLECDIYDVPQWSNKNSHPPFAFIDAWPRICRSFHKHEEKEQRRESLARSKNKSYTRRRFALRIKTNVTQGLIFKTAKWAWFAGR